jgi:sporulation protein YlmC with PRC-barrel domain
MDVLMKYHKDMHGKEVIDSYGNVLGKVKDIAWDESTKEIKFFEIGTGGIMEMLGRGDKKILPFDIIDSIGEKILINTETTEPMKEYNSRVKYNSKVKDISVVDNSSKVKDSSMVTHTSRIKDISKLNISKLKAKKNVEDIKKADDTMNMDDIEDTIEDFRIRNSF